jgi:RHS repeat-associated protein
MSPVRLLRPGLVSGRLTAKHLSLALVASLLSFAFAGAVPAMGAAPRSTAVTAVPNRLDPTSRATSVTGAPAPRPVTGVAKRTGPGHAQPVSTAAVQPSTAALDPAKASHVATADGALEVDVAAGAVSAGEMSAAGGAMSLLVRRVAPAAGGTAGGSGVFTFGTFLVQVLDSRGRLAGQGLRQPVGYRLHFGRQTGAVDVTGTVAVINRPLPPWFDPDPAVAANPVSMPRAGSARASAGAATAPARGLGPVTRQRTAVDLPAQTLSVSARTSAASASVSFDTAAPVASFGGPDRFETNYSAGALTQDLPFALPAGPGGLTPPLSLAYDSASVSDQHNPAAAASWVGEGWNLTLGRISWTQRDTALGCCPNPDFNDTWQLVDGFGTRAELIPPSITTSTYYEDRNGAAITPSPVTWHTSPDTHARVISYTGPNALPGMAAVPPCFRVFLPSGLMEEFGCTPDSLQFFPQAAQASPNQVLDFISSWLPDLITDRQGNQIHITYQSDVQAGAAGLAYPRDAVMASVEYDSPGCRNAQAACTGASWAPLMRVALQASHSVAHVGGSACPANGSLRCDDPVDLLANGGLAAPTVQNTLVLNDAQVQVRGSAGAAWNTLRDYRLAYDQSGPTTILDPFSGLSQSTAGRLDLTSLTEIGADGVSALPARSFGYTRQTELYEDSLWGPAPATYCGFSWNVGNGQGCNLWSQSYEGNSYYLTTASNGLGLQQSFGWQNARNNTWGVPSGDLLDPFVCNAAQGAKPCDIADDASWSRIILTQRSESLLRLTQAGQGGAQTSTPVTGTYTFNYRMAPADSFWGGLFDADVVDFYNFRFMGFGTVTVGNPDGSKEVHQYPGTLGRGVFDPNDPLFASQCTTANPCLRSPWWDPANATHGHEIELDRYNPDGSLQQVVQTHYRALCPSSGVAGDQAGNLVSELDRDNPVALCDIAPTGVDTFHVNGGSLGTAPHASTAFAYDAYGRQVSATVTSNDGAATGSPTTIVRKTSYTWNDSVGATASSATGTYVIDLSALTDVEDASGNRYRCGYTSYDGQALTLGQTSGVRVGQATRSDTYANCGTAANGFAPSGQISATLTYDGLGNVVAADDANALAGNAAHLGCAVGSTAFSACATYDGTFGTLRTSAANALNQRTSTGYQPPSTGTPTGGFGLWPTSATDVNGQVTGFAYDALGRQTGVTLPGEGAGLTTAATAYTVWCSGAGAQAPCAEIDRTQRLDSSTTVTSRAFYDGLGHLVETRSPAPGGRDVVAYSFHDASQRLAFQSQPYFVSAYTGGPGPAAYSIPDSSQAGTTHTYDGLGRPTSATDALSHRTSTAYSMVCGAAGTGDAACYQQTLSVDRDGHQAGVLVDAMGRTDYVQRYTGTAPSIFAVYATGRYTYDFGGDMTQILHPNGATRTTLQYDMAGRRIAMSDPDLGTSTYAYDPSGNLVQSVDARGAAGTVFIGYDGLNRPLWHNTVNSPTGAYYTYSYDGSAGGSAGVGRLTGETFSGGAGSSLSGGYTFAYDARGRQVGQTLTVGGTAYPTGATYDDAGNVLTQRYPDGEVVSTTHTPQGWLSAVSTQQGSTTTTLLSGAAYTGPGGALGDVTGASLDGGVYQSGASYDLLGRATDVRVAGSSGAVIFDQARTFDGVGNVTTVSTTLPGGTDNQAFCYDEQNRLTWAGSAGTAPCTGTAVAAGTLTAAQYTQGFTYDSLGRMVTGPLGSYGYGDPGHAHAATAVGATYTASYDAAGNMTCRAPTTASTCAGSAPRGARFGYGSEGQLLSAQSAPPGPSSSDQFLYDCQGQRVAQQVTQGGVTTTTVYVGTVEEVTTSGGATTTRTYYYAGSRRIAMAVNGVFSYLAGDGLGSTSVVLGAGGSATAAQLFAPYGGVRYSSGTMPTTYGFTGQRVDAATGLYYYDARYYDPVLGQFTSADTLVPGGGFSLWGLSRYAYTRGNPVSRLDPTGHDDFSGDFSGGGFDFSGGGFDTGGGFVDTGGGGGGFDTSGGGGGVDTGSTGFDASAPALDRSEDPIPSDTSSSASGFDPSAPALDRSEDPIPASTGGGNGFDPSAPALDRSEDPITPASPLAASVTSPVEPGMSSTDPVTLLASFVLGLIVAAGGAVGSAIIRELKSLMDNGTQRLPQDVAVDPTAPAPLPLNRPVGSSPTQNTFVQNRISDLVTQGATDMRVNQQQVDITGSRVGINRPDLQYTLNGQRFYEEFDVPGSTRGPDHASRITANDPNGIVRLFTVP